MDKMSRILEVKDKAGKIIYLTNERYKHITKHPEMQNTLSIIEQTIKNPQKITGYLLDSSTKFYYSYHKNRKSKAKYLRVVVKYMNGEGFIVTAFFVVKIV